ncbi:hypothetical protein CCYN74_40207 [Capnocytophaga cynodegmi]|uniref:Uncharacterized protein n=1 Tax=Capnocytophaga cynodegmi TaxID=28189 RepID=A0A0B7HKK8_9FLAO|nr:hypothetical protein CCYN74_40207 [Capnocytophaga cynodegmi]
MKKFLKIYLFFVAKKMKICILIVFLISIWLKVYYDNLRKMKYVIKT